MSVDLSHIKGIIYDCDGVMIDSEDANRYFYNSILASIGLAPMTRAQEEFAFMGTARESLKKMTPAKYHDRLDEIIANGVNYEKEVLSRTRLMPGFREFIHKAYDMGLKQAIDTNRTEIGIQRVLDFFNLPDYFNPVISSSNCAPKPAPDGAARICETWGVAPHDVIFVGDSENDREAAHGAHTLFAAFGGKSLEGDVEVASYDELARLLWP